MSISVGTWRFVVLFFMTIGVIAIMGTLIQKTPLHALGSTNVQMASPIFAFIGAAISIYITGKASGGKFTMDEALTVFLVAGTIILLYVVIPQYLPPSFSILRW